VRFWQGATGWYRADVPYGAVAQLAERLHGMQEVRGSIPLSSTNNHSIWSVEVAGFLSYSRPDRVDQIA